MSGNDVEKKKETHMRKKKRCTLSYHAKAVALKILRMKHYIFDVKRQRGENIVLHSRKKPLNIKNAEKNNKISNSKNI